MLKVSAVVIVALIAFAGWSESRVAELEVHIGELETQLAEVREHSADLESGLEELRTASSELTDAVERLDYEDWRTVIGDIQESASGVETATLELEDVISNVSSSVN